MKNKEAFYITGATGFLGNHLLKILSNKKDVVIYALVMANDKNINNLKQKRMRKLKAVCAIFCFIFLSTTFGVMCNNEDFKR